MSQQDYETIAMWQQCKSTFRRSREDLITSEFIDAAVEQHMTLPPVVATLEEQPMSVHYFMASRDEYDSDSEVECVALPSQISASNPPVLHRTVSIFGSEVFRQHIQDSVSW